MSAGTLYYLFHGTELRTSEKKSVDACLPKKGEALRKNEEEEDLVLVVHFERTRMFNDH